MAISEKIKDLVLAAWADGHVCLLGTVGKDGPNISPKGSMIFFDDDHLAYWERSKRKALENLGRDKRVVVVYSNMQAQREGRVESPVLRFYGTAEIHESGPVKDAIFSKLLKREQEHDGADKGLGVLIKIERAETIGGKSIR
ncbi:MAG: pyridoxamine 5'-phosphate oxidase family protein [Xanthobacteraceae bacterium]